MKVLAVTNMWPTADVPHAGVFLKDQIDSIRAAGVEVEVLQVSRLSTGVGGYVGLASQIRSRAKYVDLVHSLYGGVMALQALRGRGTRPIVVSYCGSDLLGEPNDPLLKRAMAWAGVRASLQVAEHANAVVVKSQNLADRLHGRVEVGSLHVIPNGVNLDRFRPMHQPACQALLGWTPGRKHVLFGGRPRPVKRPELARAAIELLGGRVDLHVPESVPHEEMPIWLNAADVVLLTSEHEGSPNIIKEALACNIPIVSVPVGDVPERVGTVPGCKITAGSAASLAGALSEALRESRRTNGRSAVNGLELAGVAGRMVTLYEQTLTAHHH